MTSTSGWQNSNNGNNSLGFTILPAGYYHEFEFEEAENQAFFWRTSNYNSALARYWTFRSTGHKAIDGSLRSYNGLSVRCLKDSN